MLTTYRFYSNCENELQIMMNIAKRNDEHGRVTIHLNKSNAVLLESHKACLIIVFIGYR